MYSLTISDLVWLCVRNIVLLHQCIFVDSRMSDVLVTFVASTPIDMAATSPHIRGPVSPNCFWLTETLPHASVHHQLTARNFHHQGPASSPRVLTTHLAHSWGPTASNCVVRPEFFWTAGCTLSHNLTATNFAHSWGLTTSNCIARL